MAYPHLGLSSPRPESVRLETARTILRAAHPDDASVLYDAARVPAFVEWMSWSEPSSVAVVRAHFEAEQQHWASGRSFTLSVLCRETLAVIGGAKLRREENDQTGQVVDLGYWMHPSWQRRGLASEFVPEVLRFAFLALNQRVVVAGVALKNEPSHRLLQRLGFEMFEESAACTTAKPFPNLRYRLGLADFAKAPDSDETQR